MTTPKYTPLCNTHRYAVTFDHTSETGYKREKCATCGCIRWTIRGEVVRESQPHNLPLAHVTHVTDWDHMQTVTRDGMVLQYPDRYTILHIDGISDKLAQPITFYGHCSEADFAGLNIRIVIFDRQTIGEAA